MYAATVLDVSADDLGAPPAPDASTASAARGCRACARRLRAAQHPHSGRSARAAAPRRRGRVPLEPLDAGARLSANAKGLARRRADCGRGAGDGVRQHGAVVRHRRRLLAQSVHRRERDVWRFSFECAGRGGGVGRPHQRAPRGHEAAASRGIRRALRDRATAGAALPRPLRRRVHGAGRPAAGPAGAHRQTFGAGRSADRGGHGGRRCAAHHARGGRAARQPRANAAAAVDRHASATEWSRSPPASPRRRAWPAASSASIPIGSARSPQMDDVSSWCGRPPRRKMCTAWRRRPASSRPPAAWSVTPHWSRAAGASPPFAASTTSCSEPQLTIGGHDLREGDLPDDRWRHAAQSISATAWKPRAASLRSCRRCGAGARSSDWSSAAVRRDRPEPVSKRRLSACELGAFAVMRALALLGFAIDRPACGCADDIGRCRAGHDRCACRPGTSTRRREACRSRRPAAHGCRRSSRWSASGIDRCGRGSSVPAVS